MKLEQLTSVLNLPVDDLAAIGETQILNPRSKLYETFKTAVAKKLAAASAVRDNDKKTRMKNRVYISHVVSAQVRYTLVSKFPNMDIKFACAVQRSAPTARAIYDVTTQYLMQKVYTAKGHAIAYGVDIRTIYMRSRDWLHVCIPGHEMRAQYEFTVQDRSIAAMVNAAAVRGRDTGLSRKYICGEIVSHCTKSITCDHKAPVAIAMYHRTDTNLRQIASYMRQHGCKLLYFAIPHTKEMELGIDSPVTDLDAYTKYNADTDTIDLIYRGDSNFGTTYSYKNYLELVARTEYVHQDYVYVKEIDNHFLGVSVFKVTASRLGSVQRDATPRLYRSWADPSYKDVYLVHAPTLVNSGSSYNQKHYKLESFTVSRELIDNVRDAAMRAEGEKDLAGFILRRLNASTSNVASIHQVVQKNTMMAVTRFEVLAFVLYCSVFMQKYESTQTVKALAPDARFVAEVARLGPAGLFYTYAQSLFGKSTESISSAVGFLRRFYYSKDTTIEFPMPTFALPAGFTTYEGGASDNPRFTGWDTPGNNPVYGFNKSLPGGQFLKLHPMSDSSRLPFTVEPYEELLLDSDDYFLIGRGEAIIDAEVPEGTPLRKKHLKYTVEQEGSFFSAVSDLVKYVGTTALANIDSRDELYPVSYGVEDVVQPYVPNHTSSKLYVHDVPLKEKPISDRQEVKDVVEKILNETGRLVPVEFKKTYTKVFNSKEIPSVIPGPTSTNPVVDIQDALNTIFPGSLLMNTQFFESDKFYGDMSVNLKGNRVKIDLSKLAPLKPERFYLPVIRGHVTPDVKNTTVTVLQAFEKRMFNTPDLTVPMDDNRIFESAFSAYLKVFLKPNAEQVLHELPYMGCSEKSLLQWVSNLPEAKLKKLNGQEGFSLNELDLSRNAMHVKPKTKPNLGSSYMTSIKAPQTIQYDPTNKTTAVLSPLFAQKVELEQSLLNHRTMVLQRKSLEDITRFLNQFDHRPDERGERFYVEMDYESFDKSQSAQASGLHWKKCTKFKVLPEIVSFLQTNNQIRSVSDMNAGVKAFLDVQRGSGHPDTLDGNNDVNLLALAELLLTVIDQVEFVIVQGDDVIIAMRGPRINVNHWEAEVARKFNLAMKISVHSHGYICSNDIVHLPDGHTLLVADVVKRTLSFLSMSRKDEEIFNELFISYADGMRYIEDVRVQNYLARVLPIRMRPYLKTVDSTSIALLCRANAALKKDYNAFRAMFSQEKILRHA